VSPDFDIVAFWVWYRGADFAGYQQQIGERTVQSEMLRAFAAAGLERNPVVAGRTDKGVSARMQVLSARVPKSALPDVVSKLNAALPNDVQVHLAKAMRPKFHAAWSSNSKEYRYEVSEPGDVEKLREAAALVPGTRDFRVFHFKSSELKQRTVNSVDLIPSPSGRGSREARGEGGLTLRFIGEGFARYMVRMLTGGMLQVSRGEISIDTFRAGLEQMTQFRCPTAPAEPLTLWNVGYPEDADPFTADERASFIWPR